MFLYASDQFHMQGACLALLTFDQGGNFGMFATISLLFLKKFIGACGTQGAQ